MLSVTQVKEKKDETTDALNKAHFDDSDGIHAKEHKVDFAFVSDFHARSHGGHHSGSS